MRMDTTLARRTSGPSRLRSTAVAALALTALLGLGACGSGSGSSDGTTGSVTAGSSFGDLAGRTFVVTTLMRDGSEVPVVRGTTVTLGFSDDGQISANAGCNSMGGQASIDDGLLVAGPLVSTEMACSKAIMRQEQWWGDLLSGSPGIAVDGATLTLTHDADVVTMTEQQPTPDASLTGTDWRLTSLMSDVSSSDGAVSSVPAGVDATLLFGEDGRVNGSTGCNSINGSYRVEGDQITFSQLATTLMACEGARGEVESSVLQVLDGSVTFAIDGDQLTVTQPDEDTGLGYTAVQAG